MPAFNPALQASGSGARLTSLGLQKQRTLGSAEDDASIKHARDRKRPVHEKGTLTNSLLNIYIKLHQYERTHTHQTRIHHLLPNSTIQTDQKMFGSCAARFYFPGQSTNGELVPRRLDGRGINFTAALAISQLCGAAEKYQVPGPWHWTKEIETWPGTKTINCVHITYTPICTLHILTYGEISW